MEHEETSAPELPCLGWSLARAARRFLNNGFPAGLFSCFSTLLYILVNVMMNACEVVLCNDVIGVGL